MKLKRRRIKRGRIEVIPMIDTIVILLIFYMTFSRFAEASREASIKLPASYAGEELKQLSGQIIVNMFSAQELTIEKKNYRIPELPGVIAQLRQSASKDQKFTVVLRGHQDMTYRDLSEFMKAVAKAGVLDVTFATLEPAR